MVKFFWNRYPRADRQAALFLFAGVFGLYLRTLAPGLLFGDSAEFQVAAWQLGLAHPTGYPLYLIVGSLWQHLLALAGLSPAYALNVLSAFFGAATVALLYLCMVGWLQQSSFGVHRLAALLTALLFAVNFTFWSQNLIAEVYTLHTLFMVLLLTVAGRISINPSEQGADHPVILTGQALSPCHSPCLARRAVFDTPCHDVVTAPQSAPCAVAGPPGLDGPGAHVAPGRAGVDRTLAALSLYSVAQRAGRIALVSPNAGDRVVDALPK